MTTLAIVVSLVGQAWAESANGERRALEVGDRLGIDETLIMEAGARVDLDFGDNQQLTFLGEQQITAEDRGALIEQAERLAPLESSEQPEADASTYANYTAASEGHGFVQLVRIGEIIEADGFTPVTVARIHEVLDEQGLSLQQPQFVRDEHDEDRYEESDYASGVKLAKLSISVDVVAGNDMVDATEAQQTHTLSGTVGGGVQPGDAVTVMVNGQAYATTVNADGKTWQVYVPGSELAQDNKVHASVSGVEPNGTPVSADTERPYEVDDVTPALSAELEGDLDGDGVFNASEIVNGKVIGTVTLNPDTVEVGDRLVIEDTTGTVLVDRPVTQADKDNGVSVEISVAPDDTTVSITATVTDPAGNTSDDTAQKGVDNITPAFNVELEGDCNDDGVYNESEIVNNKVPGNVTLDPDNTHPGDNIVVTDGEGNELLNRPVTQDDIDNGITVDVPVVPGQTDVDITATITDPSGNKDSAHDHKPVDNVPPGASVELKEAGPDGTYNESEIVDGKVLGEITLIPGTVAGDTIVVTDGKGNELINRPVTQDDIDNGGKISVDVPVTPGQPDVEINVELTDPAGNTGTATDIKPVDNVTPAVEVELADGSSPDGSYNKDDADNGTVDGTINLDSTVSVGDNLVVTDDKGNTLFDGPVTQADIDNGITVQVSIDGNDTELTLGAVITDEAGNTSNASDDKPVDAVTPTLTVELEGDTNGDGTYNVAEIVDGKVTGKVTLDSNTVEVGDRLVIQDGSGTVLIDRPVTQADINDGVSVDISVSSGDTEVDIKATITDPSGNSSNDADNKGVDNVTPTVEVELKPGSGPEGEYNDGDIVDGKVKGTITLDPSNTKPGDTIVVTDGNGDELINREVTQGDIDNGIPVDVPVTSGQTDVELNAKVTDPAGNTSDGKDDNNVDNVGPGATVELEPGNGPGGSYNEGDITNGTVAGEVTLTPGTVPGDTIVVTDGKGNELINRPVTQDDIDNGIPVDVPVEPGQPDVEINVELTDPAGNSSTTGDSKLVDNVTPTVTVELEDGSSPDGSSYNKVDADSGIVEGTINLDPTVVVGDHLVVTDGKGNVLFDDPVTQDNITNGITVQVSIDGNDTELTLGAVITDEAGNTSNASDDKPVDAVTPTLTAELEDAGSDDVYSVDEITDGKVTGKVTLNSNTVEEGDRLVIQDDSGTVLIDRPVTQDDINDGVSVDISVSSGDTSVDIKATITDLSGNTGDDNDTKGVDNITPTVEVELEAGSGPNGEYNDDDTKDDKVEGTVTFGPETQVGDKVTVTDKDGDPILDSNGDPITDYELTQDDIANGIVVDVPVSSGDTDVELNVTVTDPAGNTSDGKDDNNVDNVGPGASVELEPGNGPGGSYNEGDITNGTVTGDITLSPDTVPGDTIVVTDGKGNELINRPVTQDDIDNGISVEVPVEPGQPNVEVNVELTDPAGNTSDPITDNKDVDNVTPTVEVELADGSSPDGSYNKDDADNGTVEGTINLDSTVSVGDSLVVTDGKGNTLFDDSVTQADIDNGIIVQVPIDGSDTELTLDAVITDEAGNTSNASDDKPVDAVTPTLTAELEGAGSDGVYNVDEITDGKVTGKVTLDSNTVEVGDRLVIQDGSGTVLIDRPVTQADINDGVRVDISVSSGDTEVEISATITDPAGNTSDGADTKGADNVTPTLEVELEPGSGPNGEYNDSDTNDGKVEGTITFGPETQVGDKVTVTDKDGNPVLDGNGDPITDNVLTQNDINNGITVEVPVGSGDTDVELNATVTDDAGNATTGSDNNDVDNITPGANATLEPGSGPNGEYDGDDASDGKVEGTVELGPTTEVGDTVKVTDKDGNIIIERPVTQDDIDNNITVDIPVVDGQTNVEINVEIADPAGNSSNADDSNPVDNVTPTVEVELKLGSGPNGSYNEDDIVDGKVEGTVTLDPGNTEPGDTIVVTDGNGEKLINREVTQDDIDNGITVDVPVVPGQTDVELNATVTDPAGNASDGQDDNDVDNVGPGASVELEPGNGPGDSYNEGDITDGTVTGDITLSPGTVPGDTIVVTDGNGNELINRPVTQDDIDNGISVEVPVEPGQPNVEVNVELTDPAGNTSDPITDNKDVDNVTPTVEVELADGSSPDGSYNKEDADNDTVEGTIKLDPNTTKPGDNLVVTDGKGNTLFDDSVTQADIDNGVTVQVPITDTDTELELNAEITDEAGNSSTDSADKPVDSVTPTLTAELEGAGGDDVYNVGEITDGKVNGLVSLDSNTVEIGDRLVIQDGSGTVLIDRPVTQSDINDGVRVGISVSSGDTSVDIKATITDPSGNSSDDADNKAVDNITPTVEVDLESGSGPNGEYTESDTSDGKVKGAITFGPETQVGDKVTVTDKDGNIIIERPVTQDDIDNNITVDIPVVDGQTNVEINVELTDPAGNSGSASDTNPVDAVTPTLSVELQGAGSDNTYSDAEINNGKVTATVDLGSGTVEEGDQLVIKDTAGTIIVDRPVSADDIASGVNVEISVAPGDSIVSVDASITDPAGNTSNGSDNKAVDAIAPTVNVELEQGSGPNGEYNDSDTNDGKVDGTITFGPETEVGDKITVTDKDGNPILGASGDPITDYEVTQDDINNGIIVDVPVSDGDTDVELNVEITDPAGNTSSGSDSNLVDNTIPGATVELEPGTGPNGEYNEDDITDGTVEGEITLTPDTAVGDTIVVTDGNGNELINRPVTQDDIDNGISVEVPVEPGQPNVEVNVELTDPAGNTGTTNDSNPVDNVTPQVNVELETGNGLNGDYNEADTADGEVTGTVTFPEGTESGDRVVVTDKDGDTLLDKILNDDDIANGIEVDVPVTPGQTDDVEINATITDNAGNSSNASDTKPVDNVAPQVNVDLEAGNGPNGEYNEADTADGEVTGTVTFPGGAEPGDRVVVTDKDNNILLDKVLNDDDIATGIEVDVPVTPGQTDDVQLNAEITDPAGNTGTTNDSNPVDNVTPTIDVTLDGAGADGIYNADEITNDEVTATITLDDTVIEGDTLEFTDGNGDPIAGLPSQTVTQADIDNGMITVQVPVDSGDTDVELNATITDNAGNSSSVSDSKPVALGVELSIADDTVTEGDSITITATMDNVSNQDVTITLNDGSQITISAGQKSADIIVESRPDDAFVQGDEDREYEIVSVTGSGYEHINTGVSADLTIQDDEDSVTVKLDASASVEEGGEITYTARLEDADGNSIIVNNDIEVTLANGEKITINAGQANGDVTVDAPVDDVYINGEAIRNSIVGVEEVDASSNPPGSLESLEADSTQVETDITDTTDPVDLTISAPERADEGSDIEITLTVSETPETDLVITLTNGDKVTIAAGETEKTVTVTAPNNNEDLGAGGAISGETPGDWNIGIEKTEGGNYEYLDTSSNAVVKIDLDVPGLDVPEPDSQVDEAGLPAGSDSSADSEATAGTFTITAGNVDELSTVDIGSESFSLQDLKGVSTAPLTVDGAYGELTITGYDESSGEVSYDYILTKAADHSNGDVSDDFDITVTDTSGDSRTGTLEVCIIDDVPTAVNGDPQEFTEGDDEFTGNLIDNDTEGADGAFVNQISYTNSSGNLAEADIAEGGSVTVDTQHGELTVNSDGSWTYKPVDYADHSATDPNAGKGLELSDDFSYTLTDGDGDISNQATQQITVEDTVPEVGDAEDVTVDEQYLPSGTDPNNDELTQTGSLDVTPGADTFDTVFDEANRGDLYAKGLTSGGEMLDYELSEDGHTLTATADGKPVFTGTITDPTSTDAGYKFTLQGPLDNVDGVVNTDGDIELPLSFTVKDSDGDTAQGDFTVTVADNTPLDAEVSIVLDEDGSYVLSTPANATDDNITFDTDPQHGTVSMTVDGTLTYTPTGDYSGDDSFTYQYTEGGEVRTVTVNITVNPVADAPDIPHSNGTNNDDVESAEVKTEEDKSIALGLKTPVITDDERENNASNGDDYPECLGEITLMPGADAPEGTVLTDGDGNELTPNGEGAYTVVIVDDNGDVDPSLHISDLTTGESDVNYLTRTEYEAIQAKPADDRHENFDVTVSVDSFEVDENGKPLSDDDVSGTNGANNSQTITVDVQAVTDAPKLNVTAPSNPGDAGAENLEVEDASGVNNAKITATMNEDGTLDLQSVLEESFTDTDGSESYAYDITGLPEGTVVEIGGNEYTADSNGEIRMPATEVSSSNGGNPSFSITPPKDYSNSSPIEATVTLTTKDSDNDSTGTINPESVSMDLELTVNPVAGDVQAGDVETKEDTAVNFLKNIKVTDTDNGTEVINSVSFEVPGGWEVTAPTNDGGWSVSGDGLSGTYAITFDDSLSETDREAVLKDFEITPPAHSSADATIELDVKTTDTNGTVTSTEDSSLSVGIKVTPVAESTDTDSDGENGNDVSINTDYEYQNEGEEDQWFTLGTETGNSFDLTSNWSNEDGDGIENGGTAGSGGTEETFALLTPKLIAGDDARADAKGSVFRYSTNGDTSEEGGAWITQTFGGDAIEIPVEYLDTLQFLAPSNFSGQFEIKVEALTRDTDPDDGTVVEQISGESTLTNILIKPVADRPTTSVTARVTGDEDERMDLSIRPSSSDPSETFNITIDDIPDGAKLYYDGDELTVVDGQIVIEEFDASKDMKIQPPEDSNEPFDLKVGTQSVDTQTIDGVEYPSISNSFDLSVKITPKGVADEANITIEDVADHNFTEEELDNHGGVDLKELVTEATLKDDDGSETLSFKIGNLPDGFGIEGATALGNGEWSFSKKDFDDNNIKITTPKNFNGTKSLTLYSVTTEDDGDSLTVAHDVAVKVTPSPEATMNTSTSVDEDETAALEFGIQYQNGDTDESITGVWINASDVDGNSSYTLTYGANGSPLASGQDGVLLENGYYKLSGAALDSIHVKGSANWSGEAKFGVRYEVTDPAKDSTVSDATEITQVDEDYTVTVNPVTDQPTLEVTNGDGADNSFIASTSGEEVTVNLNIGNQGVNGGDYDGSETLTRILLENVPQGVMVEGADYIGNDQWLFIKDDAFSGPLSDSLTLRFTDGAGGLNNHKIDITVTTEDAGNGDPLPAKESIEVSTSFAEDNTGDDEPAKINDWSDNSFAPTEDTEFSLNEAVTGKIENGVTNNGFNITLSDLPEGTQVEGMTATQINGQTVWTASETGGNSEMQTLLGKVKITPPEHWNSNDGPFEFNAKLTTFVPSGQRTEEKLNLSQQVTPVSDAPEVDINAPAVDEDNDLTFSFDISNPADDPGANWNLVDGKLYLKLDDSDINDGGSLVDSNGDPLATETVTDGNGLTAGDYYVVNLGGSNSVDVTYKPNNANSSGSVSVEGWIQSQESGASNQIFGQGSQTADINPINSGYDFEVGKVSGTENASQQVAGDKSNLIELDITDNGLVDDDGSESLQTVLLSNLPKGFLVYVGEDANSATEAALSNNAGGDGITNTWLLGQGEMPGYVAIMPPQNWSGTLSDIKLQVISGENALDESHVDEKLFELAVEAKADGLTIAPTPSFGTEGEIIDLNLNHTLVDPEKVGNEDSSVETLTLEFEGLGKHAGFYADLNGDGTQSLISGTDKVVDDGDGKYTVSGLTSAQAETLGFKQAANGISDVKVRARTEEGSNDSTSEWTSQKDIKTTIKEQFGTTGDDSLLYTGEYIDGRGDQAETGGTGDTIQLRFGEDVSASDLATNLANIETLDLSVDGSNAIGDNSSGLSIEDVLNITDGDKALKIDGNVDDSVFLKNNEWTNDGSNGSGYVVYTDTTSGAQLSISEQITSITMVD